MNCHLRSINNIFRYLKLPDIPPDVARNNTVQDLLDLYQNLIDEFKEVHKRTRLLQKENASEIINDIKEMALERDIGKFLQARSRGGYNEILINLDFLSKILPTPLILVKFWHLNFILNVDVTYV